MRQTKEVFYFNRDFMHFSLLQGDRLSHAVGCAFAICLEKKQKRDQECAVTMNFDNTNSSFTRIGTFRHATLSERLTDPQVCRPPHNHNSLVHNWWLQEKSHDGRIKYRL
jgi:hypothetical protein